MDQKFPEQLFPSFYNCGPPDSVLKHCAGTWGSYDRLRPEGGSGPLSSWTFTSRHRIRGETWCPTEPIPIPLLSPKNSFLWPTKPPDPLDFTEHMQNFFTDQGQDAFGCMGEILGPHFNFNDKVRERNRKDSVNMWRVKNVIDRLSYKICPKSYTSKALTSYGVLLSDVVHSVPPELLGSLLYEELTEQRDRQMFDEGLTGGALDFIPLSQNGGCLLYPAAQGLNQLNFHRVELQHHAGSSSALSTSTNEPFRFQLKGPIRQISSASLFNNCCVAVRSDHFCGVWRFSEENEPRLLQVVNTSEVATCVSASPHVLGEVLVASESGVVNLWTVGKGMQKVREEDGNLYFNANSSWRWCEFSAHPRVMLYADRTGAELTDIRVNPAGGHTLFRISNTSECRRGERLILSRYLGHAHSFHHLITTQYSAYIMDERFPCVPMLKLDHMMQSPPLFCHVLPGSVTGGAAGSTKVALGSHSAQEITLLQYSGGGAEACFSRGPPQALLRPRESLKHLPVQIPHRLETASHRLSSPAAGLTCVQNKGDGEECICVLQLTEAGDLFYQILEPDAEEPPPRRGAELPNSELVVPDTSSDEDVIGPSQAPPRFVAETPERATVDSNSEESDSERKGRRPKPWGLQVVVNDEPEIVTGRKDGEEGGAKADADGEEESVCSSSRVGASEEPPPVQLSHAALTTWKLWLQKLMKKSREKKPRPLSSRFFRVETGGVLQLPDDAPGQTTDARMQSLRRDLRASMSRRSLLLHSSVSSSLLPPPAVPFTPGVEAESWTDPLSQRLTLSWRGGEEAWRAWWDDQLGLNREEKVKALRRKRRREKEAKRVSGLRMELSGSFTSSVSYQSDLDSFSDSQGGWSCSSQGAGSDHEEGAGPLSKLVRLMERETPSTVVSDTPVATPTASAPGDPQTPSSHCTASLTQAVKLHSTPASQRWDIGPAEDMCRPLIGPQEVTSQRSPDFLREGSLVAPPLSAPRRTGPRVDLSQSLSLTQSSQGRLSQASQSSQVKRKKSRMGF